MSRQFSSEESRSIIDKLFGHYKKKIITEREFRHFLEGLGYSAEEIDEILFQAFKQGLIDLGVEQVGRKYVMAILKPLGDEEEE
ncbi:MAG: hypothetical protein DRJ68_04610 [Thermoprotei archaeon]|nr:MAG: hypothetical protein DRJ62_04375 [Thermoprotei archaeon]RLF20858.1 MAG: hypothetical protein DRJ68_04610 [Thermoprotei archaeon]